MTSPDQDLKDFLAGRSDLSQRYRAMGGEQPPAELDRAILAQAAAAVAGNPSKVVPLPRRSRARWMVPFAVAATVVLSFAIFREAGVGTGVVPQESAVPVSAPARTEFLEEREAKAEAAADASAGSAPAAVLLEQPAAISAPAPPPPPAAPAVAQAPAPAANAIQSVTANRPAAALARARTDQAPGAPQLNPDDWLRDIRTLREAGRNEEANTALENFLKAYPDYFERNPGVARP